MRDRELYARILGIEPPWAVADVELKLAEGQVVVRLEHRGAPLACPECGQACPGYDTQPRQWRHLDTCQFHTLLEAAVPRCRCPAHGVKQVRVPWAEPGGRFTALFERLAIDWMQAAGRAATARRLALSWDEADGIMQRAVRRGLARRAADPPGVIGVDEKSFQGREFVTVVCDLDQGTVLHVADGRGRDALAGYFQSLSAEQKAGIEAVAMDMWEPYVQTVVQELPDGAGKVVFDKFHIAKLAGDAVDQVRRQENKQLTATGDDRLKRTRYGWLRNPQHETVAQRRAFGPLRRSKLRTARAWAIKETLMDFFTYQHPAWARKFFDRWYGWARRSRLAPIKRLATSLKTRLTTLLNYFRCPVTNAASESLNSKIQWIKYTARGFRSRQGFRTAIYFHCGGLDLYPH